jgi:hypothetical protein
MTTARQRDRGRRRAGRLTDTAFSRVEHKLRLEHEIQIEDLRIQNGASVVKNLQS